MAPNTFTIPEEFAGLRIYSGGRNYEWDGTELEAAEEADARRVRVFAVEHPEYGIAEDGEVIGYEPAPEAEPEQGAAQQTQDQIQEVLDQAHEQGILEEPASAEAAMAAGVVAASIEERGGETVLVEEVAPVKPLARMNREELLAVAAEREVEVPEYSTKAAIRAALEAA